MGARIRCSADTTSDLPKDTLVERYFPNVPRSAQFSVERATTGRWSLLDGTRARAVLDYSPAYHRPDVLAIQPSGREGNARDGRLPSTENTDKGSVTHAHVSDQIGGTDG